MPRPARYDVDALLDTALDLFVEGGIEAVTVTGVARRAGAPSGSLYHRFAGRDALLAALWLRTVERFQAGYVAALEDEDPDLAAHRAVRYVIDWARRHPAQGLLLARHGADDLLPSTMDDEIRRRAAAGQRRVEDAIKAWRRSHPAKPTRARSRLALVDLPYAAVRPYLQASNPVPTDLGTAVEAALGGILAST